MKKLLIAVTTAASILALSACNNADNSDIVAETSAGNISKDEFYNSMKEQVGNQILRDMIYTKVLAEKYEISDDLIDEKYEEIKTAYGDQFNSLVEERGEDSIREIIKSDLLKQEATRANLKDMIHASHILVEKEETAKEVKKKLDEGEKFEDLAKEYSTDGSAQNGGDLGWFTKGAMVPAFEDAAFALEKDQISDPVKSDFGFHIIKLNETQEDYEKKTDEEKDTIINTALQRDPSLLQKILDEAVNDAEIEIKDKDLEDIFAADAAAEDNEK